MVGSERALALHAHAQPALDWRVLVVGYGVQGQKRRRHAGDACIGVVDPARADADWRELEDVPTDAYDAAVLCTPDAPKIALLEYLVAHGKHALIEKPLWSESAEAFSRLEAAARAQKVAIRAAYNHRFEPHILRLRDLIDSGALGKLYRCRLFYGNGTARLVRDSVWRDAGSGVVHDLGSHLLDMLAFWFGEPPALEVVSADAFENRAPDHAVLGGRLGEMRIDAEMTLLSWRNHFIADLIGAEGSAHIASLCKWGPSVFTHRRRVLPSGRPPEESVTLVEEDPTWALEYADFKRFAAAVAAGEAQTSLAHDAAMNHSLGALGAEAVRLCGGANHREEMRGGPAR